MRNRFDEQLSELNRQLVNMASLCEETIAVSAKALMSGDAELAAKTAPVSDEINRLERDIETMCLKLLLQQQPVAKDLRQITAALKMVTDYERIGDQAADIAEIIEYLGGRTVEDCEYIGDMARAVIKMVNESVDAFVKHDINLAEAVIAYDDVVDDLFNKIKVSLIKMIAEKPQDGEYAIDLLMIAKHFERSGDHAVGIAEWVVFSVTGSHKEDSV